MKINKYTYVCLLFVVASGVLVGCQAVSDKFVDQSDKLQSINDKQKESVAVYVQGSTDSLSEIPADSRAPQVGLALKLNGYAQNIVGVPTAKDRLDVDKLLASQQAEIHKLQGMVSTDNDNAEAKEKLEKELAVTKTQLLQESKLYELEKHKHLMKSIWTWLVGSLGLIGAIAFVVFCPQIAIPIITLGFKWMMSIAGWLVTKLTSFASNLPTTIKNLETQIGTAVTDIENHGKTVTPTPAPVVAPVVVPATPAVPTTNV